MNATTDDAGLIAGWGGNLGRPAFYWIGSRFILRHCIPKFSPYLAWSPNQAVQVQDRQHASGNADLSVARYGT